MEDKEKIIYEPHPVTTERKAELRAKGLKIIDARFDPSPKKKDEKKEGGKKGESTPPAPPAPPAPPSKE